MNYDTSTNDVFQKRYGKPRDQFFEEMKKKDPYLDTLVKKIIEDPTLSYNQNARETTLGLIMEIVGICGEFPKTLKTTAGKIKKGGHGIKKMLQEYKINKLFEEFIEDPAYGPREKETALQYIENIISELQKSAKTA